jgi:hypothetical protein
MNAVKNDARSNVIDLSAKVTAVSDAVATATPCGAIVFWALSGDTTVEALSKALDDANSAAVRPEAPSLKVATTRACEAVAARHGLKLQPIARSTVPGMFGASAKQAKTRSRATGGYALSRPLSVRDDGSGAAGLGRLDGPIVALAKAAETRLGADGTSVRIPASFEGEPAMVQELRDELVKAREVLTPSDVGAWLCERVLALDGFSLKPNGGTYFIPEGRMVRFQRICEALGAATGHRIFTIPALKTAKAIETILTALELNTAAAIQAVAEAVATGEGGKRALETKERELAALMDRLGKYEDLLGRKLDGVRAQAETARAAVAVAMIAASADETSTA